MKLGAIPESLAERLALGLNLVPRPLVETLPTLLAARSLMAAARFGLPQALAEGPLGAGEVAARCGTDPRATKVLLDTLVGLGYVREGYELTGDGRRWLLPLNDSLLYRHLEWEWIGRLDEFVKTGRALDIHGDMIPEQWSLYQGGMADVARLGTPEQARRIPVPKGARDLLDVGGSHGLLSVALCRRHPNLRAVVLDLPEAVEHAAPILEREGMGDRVAHRPGDVLKEDLGTGSWDVVLLSNLAHHFDDATNRELTRRIAAALRPGGVFAIVEIYRRERRESPTEGGQIGALLDLYFALTSQSGTWSFAEMAAWQREAGLRPRKPVRLRRSPGFGIQIAVAR